MTTRRFRGLYRFRHYGLWGPKYDASARRILTRQISADFCR